MPTKREILIYTFDELSDKAKQKALDDYRHKGWGFDEFHVENLSEWFIEVLKDEWGIEVAPKDLQWQLSYVQGDDVAFSGDVDLDKFLKKMGGLEKFKALKRGGEWIVWARVTTTRYGHGIPAMGGETELDYDYEADDYDAMEALAAELEETVKEGATDAGSELMSAGYKEIEYQSSDEVIAENITANDYEYDEQGNMI